MRGISSGAAQPRLRPEAAFIKQLWTIGQAQSSLRIKQLAVFGTFGYRKESHWNKVGFLIVFNDVSIHPFSVTDVSIINKTLPWSLSVRAP